MFEAAVTMLHRPCSCLLQDGKLHFQQHATILLQVWVRDVLEAQQVLDYRTGQRFKKSEVPTLLVNYQHHDYTLHSLQPGMISKCMPNACSWRASMLQTTSVTELFLHSIQANMLHTF